MKTLLISLFLAIGVLTSPVVVTGCKAPTAEKVAYRSITAVVYAVDTAKNVYYDYRKIHGVTPATEAKFKAKYEDYQKAMKVVKEVYKANQVPTSDSVVTIGNELIELIREISGNTQLKRI